jgi:plasmid maintenance system antidote protein VapI
MDQHAFTRADLVPRLGTPSRVSEVLTGKRELSMSMLRNLRDRFHVSADQWVCLWVSGEIRRYPHAYRQSCAKVIPIRRAS